MATMTHDELVERAARWLRNSAWRPCTHQRKDGTYSRQSYKCGVVLTEASGGCTETPDAIGWLAGGRQSMLIECKVSVSDFKADAKKHFRRLPKCGVGNYRYYMTPPGLLDEFGLPDGWGLLESHGRTVVVVRHGERFESDLRNEMSMLWSECRKIQIVERGGELFPTRAGTRIMKAIRE